MKRSKMRKGHSKRVFRKTAVRTHKKNLAPKPTRGGYRL